MKNRWFQSLSIDRRESLSELSVLLKTIDRLFIIENLSLTDIDYPNRNFYDELIVVRDVILRIINIIESIIPESEKNYYWFRKYAEQKFISTTQRDTLREELYRQDSEEKGLLLLYDTFVNIKTLVTDLLKSQTIPYMSYKDIGEIISREIRENRYFNPFKRSLSEEDRIDNPVISGTVRSIQDQVTKKYVSLVMISLFRILRRLRYVITDSSEQSVLNRSIGILFLIRSELEDLKRLLEMAASKITDRKTAELMAGLSYQVSMETRRVFLQEMKDITKRGGQKRQRGRIENSAGIIKNFIEQTAVQIIQLFNPGIRGEEIFPTFITKKQLSIKLREDVAVMHRLVSSVLESKGSTELFDGLRSYIQYFQSFTYRLLRYDDYEEFSNFIEEILKFLNTKQMPQAGLVKFLDRLNHFKIFLETVLRQISQREELLGEPLDEERLNTVVQQFL